MAETKQPMVTAKMPKSIQIQYYVTTIEPNTSEYATCELCKNFTEAKRLYKKTVDNYRSNVLVSCVMEINRNHGDVTRNSTLVLARTTGKVKV